MRVQPLLSTQFRPIGRDGFGGSLGVGQRKAARPIVSRKPMHVVLRSSQATGEWSLYRSKVRVRVIVDHFASRFGVSIYEYANAGNHIHLVVRAVSRNGFKKFLMAISGRIAELVTKASRKNPLAQPFWDFIPWTRILEWGRAFEIAKHYVIKNQLEAAGVIAYRARKNSRQPPGYS